MTTKASDKVSLEIKRFINAPRDRVYAAWTDPAQMRQWFGPENVQTRDLIADARVGEREQILDIELVGRHGHRSLGPSPQRWIAIGIDLDAVAFGIVEIDRFADQVIGKA